MIEIEPVSDLTEGDDCYFMDGRYVCYPGGGCGHLSAGRVDEWRRQTAAHTEGANHPTITESH